MSERWRQLTGETGRRLHGDQSGAIALAALAALMILILVTLTIWDAGQSARDTIDAQNAADTAAHSQASVRARAMNMLAFTNVAKREVVSLHSLYYGMFSGFAIWWAERCKGSANADDSRIDCENNRRLLLREGGIQGEWRDFSGQQYKPIDEPHIAKSKLANQMAVSVAPSLSSFSREAFGAEVMALDDYQRYLVEVAPWWAWTQALIRGTRNGAHATTSFPPPGRASAGSGWIQEAVGGISNQADGIFDFEVSCGDREADHLLNRPHPGLDPNEIDPTNASAREQIAEMPHGSCIPVGATGQVDGVSSGDLDGQADQANRSPATDPVVEAIGGNVELHRRESEADAGFKDPLTLGVIHAIEASPPLTLPHSAGGGCWWSTFLFTNVMMHPTQTPENTECAETDVRFYSTPYSLGAPQDDVHAADALMTRSNLVFSYRHTPERAMRVLGGKPEGTGSASSHRNLMSEHEYAIDNPGNPIFSTSGYWSMARAEVVYPHLDDGRDVETGSDSARGLWLFRPGWTAKLRPVALPGEWRDLDYQLNDAFHATDEYMRVAEEMGLFDNANGPNAAGDMLEDVRFMDQATRTLTDQRIEGVSN